MSSKLIKTSVQLPQSTLDWLSTWKGLNQSQAIRLILEREHRKYHLRIHDLSRIEKDNHDELIRAYKEDNLRYCDHLHSADRVIGTHTDASTSELEYAMFGLSLDDRIRLLDLVRQRLED